MKLHTTFFLCSLGLQQGLSAQNSCEGYFSFTEGAKRQYTYYDQSGKLLNTSTAEVSVVETADDGSLEAQLEESATNDLGKPMLQAYYQVRCKDSLLLIDLPYKLPPRSRESFSGMEVDISGDPFALPVVLKAGQTLPDAYAEIKAGNSGMIMLTMQINVINRKVLGAEKVKTSAGEFECVKISHTMETKTMVKKTHTIVEWYAKGIGLVKQETYDKKGVLEGYALLTGM
jgi:hypothetical protein